MTKQNRINEQIRVKQVRLIDEEGQNQGIVEYNSAIQRARNVKLDLVEVSGGEIPVCRILDYSKYVYEQKSKLRKARLKKTDLKEFQFGPNIGEGDLKLRIERGRKFLQAGNMVKYTVVLKGRANLHPEFGETKLKIVESELSDVSKIDKPMRKMGNRISFTLISGQK